jgi:hypothetical protein
MSEASTEAARRYPPEWFYTEGSTDPSFTPRRIPIHDGREDAFLAGAMWAADRAATEADRGYLASERCDDIAARIRDLVAPEPTEPEST